MVLTAESLGLIFLLVSAGALGMSLVHDVGKLSAVRTRIGLLLRQTEKKRALINEWRNRIDGLNKELRAQQARFTEFNGKKQKLQTEMRELDQKKVEFVHELGDPHENVNIFWSRLRPMEGFKKLPRQDIVFSRQIWDYRNVAHVRAAGPEAALVALAGVFGVAGCVLASEIVPLAMAPPDGEDLRDDPAASVGKEAAA